jgi:hypothetical protein
MNRKLKTLCILVLSVLFFYIAGSFICSLPSIAAGFKAGMHDANKDANRQQGISNASKYDKSAQMYADQAYAAYIHYQYTGESECMTAKNVLSKKEVKLWPDRASVSYDRPMWLSVLQKVSTLAIFITGIWALVLFIRFIYRINKTSDIFSWDNVKLLKHLGIMLLIYSLISTTFNIIDVYQASLEVEIKGFSIDYSGSFEFMGILLGLVALIISEIFSIGLKLREENELTI